MPEGDPASKSVAPSATSIDDLPATLRHPGAIRFWLAVVIVGVGTGLSAGLLTLLLERVQGWVWGAAPTASLYASVLSAPATRRVTALVAAGAITGLGQVVLSRLSSGNGID